MSTTISPRELTGDYVIDAAHTRIGFVARHTLSTRVRGQFEEFDGDVRLHGDHPSESAARLTIRSASLQTRQRQRDDQLRSTFLDTDKHPSITFTSTGVEPAGDTAYKVTGDLTMRGVAKPVTLTVELTAAETDSSGDLRVQFRGGVTINRNDWGVNWNAATSVLVSPKVTLEFDVIAVRLP
ncbi:polyisoprenoid-binding protein [Streptomyces longisporoflavus]|uniref:YceI family protein n=1 Tax=Streptomyces longisporoflavus TaxID=28044 RepID=UPI00167DBDCC|nr:YceI family protein [Streptomyces longisporoflavus]GGV36180.1 polyisoprenoid-binding protein [Streptomyces longisporoflavus]